MDQDKITNLQTSYDHIAEEYVQRIYDELKDKPLDRQLLDRFASSVQGLEPVCDMGCGPGHVGRYLHEQGVAQVIGVDLSPSMLEQARRLNPGIEFIQGNMLALDTENDAWGGIAAFYSIIHIPREEVVTALCEAARSHQSIFYNLLFRASADTTQRLAQDPHFVGGQLGLVGILHTWGRNLSYHPHIHYLVPAGGLAADGHTLRCSGQAWHPARRDFLLPVKALSKIFRGKFRQALQKTALCTRTRQGVAAGLGCSLQAGGRWSYRPQVPGPVYLPRRQQQPPPSQTGARSGHFSLSHF